MPQMFNFIKQEEKHDDEYRKLLTKIQSIEDSEEANYKKILKILNVDRIKIQNQYSVERILIPNNKDDTSNVVKGINSLCEINKHDQGDILSSVEGFELVENIKHVAEVIEKAMIVEVIEIFEVVMIVEVIEIALIVEIIAEVVEIVIIVEVTLFDKSVKPEGIFELVEINPDDISILSSTIVEYISIVENTEPIILNNIRESYEINKDFVSNQIDVKFDSDETSQSINNTKFTGFRLCKKNKYR